MVTSYNAVLWDNTPSVRTIFVKAKFTSKEAIEYIKKRWDENSKLLINDEEVKSLAKLLHYHPLALTQAISYIFQGNSIARFCEEYEKYKADALAKSLDGDYSEKYELELMSELPKDEVPQGRKIYFCAAEEKIKYIILSESSEKIEDFLDIKPRVPFTKGFLNSKKNEILKETSKRGHTHSASVITVTNFAIARLSALAKAMLYFCSFLHSKNILMVLLEESVSKWGEKEKVNCLDVIEELQVFSLLTRYNDISEETLVSYELHELVQELIRIQISQDDTAMQTLSLQLLAFFWNRLHEYENTLTSKDTKAKKILKQLSTHAKITCGHINYKVLTVKVKQWYAGVLTLLGQLFCWHGDYIKAQECHEQVLKVYRTIYDNDNYYRIAISLSNFGYVFYKQGNYVKALEYSDSALNAFIASDDHDDILGGAGIWNNLGLVFDDLGQHGKAQNCYERALKICKTTACFSDNYPDKAVILNNFGRLSRKLGNYEMAKFYHKQALKMHRDFHRDDNHVSIAKNLNNLALAFHDQGNYAEAQECYNQALKIYRDIHHGDNHPDIAESLSNLGMIFFNSGDSIKAQEHYEQALEIYKIYHCDNHPNLAVVLNNLSSIFKEKNDYTKAQEYDEKALKICRAIYQNDNHPDIARSLSNLGFTFYGQRNYVKAQECYEQALKIYETVGGFSSEMALSLNNFGLLLNEKKEYVAAQKYFEEALKIYKIIYGDNKDFGVARVLNNLGCLFENAANYLIEQGHSEQALQMYRKAQEHYEQAFQIYRVIYGNNEQHPNIREIIIAKKRVIQWSMLLKFGVKFYLKDGSKSIENTMAEEKKKELKIKYKLTDLNAQQLAKGLRNAAVNGKLDDLKIFIELGADINASDDKQKMTALHHARRKGHVRCADFLIEKGARRDLLNASGEIADDYAQPSSSMSSSGFFKKGTSGAEDKEYNTCSRKRKRTPSPSVNG